MHALFYYHVERWLKKSPDGNVVSQFNAYLFNLILDARRLKTISVIIEFLIKVECIEA